MAVKKVFKKILLGIGLVFLLALLALGAAVTFVVMNPQATWDLVQKKFLPADLKITWEKLDVDFRHRHGLKFSFEGDIGNFRLTKGSPSLDVPVEQIHWRLLLHPFSQKEWVLVQDIKVHATEPVKFQAGAPQADSTESSPFEQLHKSITLLRKSSKIQIKNFDLNVADFVFTSYEGKVTHVSAQVGHFFEEDNQIDFNAKVLLPNEPPSSLSLQGSVFKDRFESEKPFLEATLKVLGWGVSTEQKISVQDDKEDTLLLSRGEVIYKKDKIRLTITPDLAVRVRAKGAEMNLKASAQGLPGPVVRVRNFQAQLNVPFASGQLWSGEASDFVVSAPIDVFFIDAKMKPPMEKACECKIPESLKFDYRGKVWLKDLLGTPANEKKVLESRLSLESIDNKLLSLDFAALLDMQKHRGEFTYQPRLDTHVVLHSFRGLRNFLDAKNVLIPAPLDILEGQIEFTAKGPLTLNEKVYDFPMNARVRLNSKSQQVHLEADSSVQVRASLEEIYVKLLLKIQDLQLELPPLDPVGGIPRIAPDSRILKKPKSVEKKPKKKFKVAFDFEVQTVQPGAIRLLSKYANPYLPLTISMALKGTKETQGFLQTEPFKVEYLRRVVQVEKFRMDFAEIDKNILPISGRLRIDQADYKIYIHFDGTVQQPQMSLTSEPYLSQNEIISVLLYGRTSDQLVSADAQTAGSFEAAMADRAIGLFGLWAFAATPIQSFSYNPVTKVYTATVMITEDLTAGIGTNWEESARLELRKRVSRRWMLTASWTPNGDGDLEEKLVLQWEKRF